ncbi:MAG: hypothetical protein LBR24_03165 [Methanobrevibacter sp.]|jgi:hypothetical protein|nr:hypothetical protein [Methanobrevibacter sp.]
MANLPIPNLPIPELCPPTFATNFNLAETFEQNQQAYQRAIRNYFRDYPPLDPMPDFLNHTLWDPRTYPFLRNRNIPTRPSTRLLVWDYRQSYDYVIFNNPLYSVNNPAYCPYAVEPTPTPSPDAPRTNGPRIARYHGSYENLDEDDE